MKLYLYTQIHTYRDKHTHMRRVYAVLRKVSGIRI